MAVPVHGVVPAADGGDQAHAQLAHFGGQLFDVIQAGGRGHVAAIQKAVDIDFFQLLPLAQLQQGVQMGDMAVHTAIGYQAHQVEGAAGLFGVGTGGQ